MQYSLEAFGRDSLIKDKIDITDDILGVIFNFIDAPTYFTIVRVSKHWFKLVENTFFWERMWTKLKQMISLDNENYDILPTEYEIECLLPKGLSKLSEIKTRFKILSTCFLVTTEPVEVDETLIKRQVGHTVMRKRRVYSDIEEAMESACPFEYIKIINVPPRNGPEIGELSIGKPLHIFGQSKLISDGNDNLDYLNVEIDKDIIFKDVNGATLTNIMVSTEVDVRIFTSQVYLQSIITSRFVIGDGADVVMNKITCDSIDQDFEIFQIESDFVSLCVEDSFFGNSDLILIDGDLIKIIDKIESSIKSNNPRVVSCCVRTVVSFLLNCQRLSATLSQMRIVDILLSIFKQFDDHVGVIVSSADLLSLLAKTSIDVSTHDIAKLRKEEYNMIPYLVKALERFSDQSDLVQNCTAAIRTIVNVPYHKKYFKAPELYESMIRILDKHRKSVDILPFVLCCIWDCAHEIKKSREYIFKGINIILNILDENLSNSSIQHNACGVLGNLGNVWTQEMIKETLKRVLPSIRATQEDANALSTVLGMTISILKMNNERDNEVVNLLIREGIISILLELKGRHKTPEIEEKSWKIIIKLIENNLARKELAFKISKNQKYAPITHLERCEIARALTVQDDVDENVFKTLEKFLKKTQDPKVFFICLDAVVHLAKNKQLINHQEKIKGLSQILFQRTIEFSSKELVRNWIGWAELYIKQKQYSLPLYYIDLNKTVDINIASDGLTIRHDFNGYFGSAIGSKSVSKGLWYYEVTLHSDGIYQIGWVDDKFIPDTDQGMGVGDDEHSWAIDLNRNYKWHKKTEPYGEGIQWAVGGIVQCYLDLDKKIMSFGYDGKFLGTAFEDFDIGQGLYPALTTDRENGCKFNFGSFSFLLP